MKTITASFIAIGLLGAAQLQAAGITPGNGVFIDDVSYDMACAADSTCPSVTRRLAQYAPNTTYLFPDFGYIDTVPATGNQPASIQSTCGKLSPGTVATYYAMPMIKPDVFNEPSLGQCQAGTAVTAHYAQNGKYRVLPLFTASGSRMFDQASTAQLTRLATAIAQLINDDPNAAGVAFDIEPAFKNPTTTRDFFGTLAKQLSNGKIIAVFDANRRDLAALQLHNALVLQALYDYGAFPNYLENQAIPLADYDGGRHPGYATLTQQYARAYFGNGNQPQMNVPVMFVLPGSATSTIWSALQFYNQGVSTKGPGNPYPNTAGAACLDQPPSWLNQFLTEPNGHPGNGLASAFVGSGNCTRYDNTQTYQGRSVTFIDYFEASLNAVQTVVKALPSEQQTHYIGSALYTMRAAGPQAEDYNDIDCAKHYYSVYGTKSLLSRCIGVFPTDIGDTILQAFSK
ncbi:hypothetical protein [Endothiovibrio diazotrophicus]